MRNEDFMQSSNGVIRIVSLYAGFGLPLDYSLCLRFEGGVFLGIPSRPGIPTWCGGVWQLGYGDLSCGDCGISQTTTYSVCNRVLITPGKRKTAYTKVGNVSCGL